MKNSIFTLTILFCAVVFAGAQCPTDLMTEFYWENSNGNGADWDMGDSFNEYNFGPVDVDVRLIDDHGQNVDSNNSGTSLGVYTRTMGSYGEDYLTVGMTSENSDQEVSFLFTFSEPVFLNDFEISDIDYVGYGHYDTNRANQSYQDEVHVVASLNGVEVPITIAAAAATGSKVTIDQVTQSVVATYRNQKNGNIAADDDNGKVFLTGATAIDYFKVIYSNGPKDAEKEQQAGAGSGKSDDHAIRLGTFFHCAEREALPVELAYFEGECTGDEVILEWATVSEINNDYFQVERSHDGRSFQAIGKIDGHGNSTDVIEYTFTDKSSRGSQIYYRLKQIDFDGAFEYSDVTLVENCIDQKVAIRLFPNPTVDRITVELGIQEEATTINITDLTGRIVMTEHIAQGENRKQIAVNHLPTGTYIVLVRGDNPQTQKFIKQGAGL